MNFKYRIVEEFDHGITCYFVQYKKFLFWKYLKAPLLGDYQNLFYCRKSFSSLSKAKAAGQALKSYHKNDRAKYKYHEF